MRLPSLGEWKLLWLLFFSKAVIVFLRRYFHRLNCIYSNAPLHHGLRHINLYITHIHIILLYTGVLSCRDVCVFRTTRSFESIVVTIQYANTFNILLYIYIFSSCSGTEQHLLWFDQHSKTLQDHHLNFIRYIYRGNSLPLPPPKP